MATAMGRPEPVWLTFRLPLRSWCARNMNQGEWSGAVGDLGTFIPLYVGMSMGGAINPQAALFFAGLQNVLTGLTFSVPMPVQPMKAIAAAAIAQHLHPMQVAGGGFLVGATVLVLGSTGLIDLFNRLCPKAVVRGIQLGLGLSLALKGMRTLLDAFNTVWTTHAGWSDFLCGALGLGLLLMLLPHLHQRRLPIALAYFILGMVYAWASVPAGITAPTTSTTTTTLSTP